jgi:hypothetical protein
MVAEAARVDAPERTGTAAEEDAEDVADAVEGAARVHPLRSLGAARILLEMTATRYERVVRPGVSV